MKLNEIEVEGIKEIIMTNTETGEVYKIDPSEFSQITYELDVLDEYKDCTATVTDFIKEPVSRNALRCIDGMLSLVCLDNKDNEICKTDIVPNIINVQHPNEKTVFVEFADGSKEIAHLKDGDVFNLEFGVLICIVKKIFSDMGIIGAGSSVYNKLMKYALSKLDYTKRAKEATLAQRKAEKRKLAQVKRDVRKAENHKCENRIREVVEAYKKEVGDAATRTSREIEEAFRAMLGGFKNEQKV